MPKELPTLNEADRRDAAARAEVDRAQRALEVPLVRKQEDVNLVPAEHGLRTVESVSCGSCEFGAGGICKTCYATSAG